MFMASRVGENAYFATAMGVLLVWLSGCLALSIAAIPVQGPNKVSMIMLAMLVRMIFPLGAILFVQQTGHSIGESGFIGSVLICYLVSLVLETMMSVRFISEANVTANSGA